MHDLSRFHEAQAGVIEGAIAELAAGAKLGHWMWFVFPQLRGLGRSATARHFAIAGLDEARAYLADPVLGPRLIRAGEALLAHSGRPAEAILGPVDAMKLRSSATLFREAGGGPVFRRLLDAFFDGAPCPLTLQSLRRGDEP